MFTGIITALGRVDSLKSNDFGLRLVIDPGTPDWPAWPRAGDSVAVSGCCLTLAPRSGDAEGHLAFDVIKETLDKTKLGELSAGSAVNLELSLTASTPMGGHFVQGHVDGVGVIEAVKADAGEVVVTISTPPALTPYIVPKGSISVDGVSLTIAAIEPAAHTFRVALIPTTLQRTTLGQAQQGQRVNLECDMIAKTVVHCLSLQRQMSEGKPAVTMEALRAAGFVEAAAS